MTLLSRLLTLFPTLMLLLVSSCLYWLLVDPGILSIVALLFCLYGFPVVVYRIHQYFYPIKEGISDLIGEEYNPWWGTQQIQLIYNTFPYLERILHLVPGLYSFWLRLWGAKIGKNVYWVPSVLTIDRGLIEVGDGAILGLNATTCAHTVKPKKDRLIVFVQKIKIGNNAFIGGDVRISPGVHIEDGAFVPYGEWIYPKVKFKAEHQSNLATSPNATPPEPLDRSSSSDADPTESKT